MLHEVSSRFRIDHDVIINLQLCPSGLLREQIERDDRPDLFLSADIGHPRRLAEVNIAKAPVVFTRNELCLLAHQDLGITTDYLIERLRDPSIRVATPTPVSDPGGDYAWQVFEKVDLFVPGSSEALKKKAIQAVGGSDQKPAQNHRSPVLNIFSSGQMNAF